ncbi:MAG: hypothetical protein KDD42_02155 [Bdellovibrionales bacterium]|nr:hypothetical protein [Bdellovibrionales bacterium]
MTSILIAADQANQEATRHAIAEAKKIENARIFLVGSNDEAGNDVTILPSSNCRPANILRSVLEQDASEVMIIMNPSLNTSGLTEIASFMCEHTNGNMTYVPVKSEANFVELQDLSLDNIVSSLSQQRSMPLLCIGLSRSIGRLLSESQAESMTELMMEAIVRTVQEHHEIIAFSEEIDVASAASSEFNLSDAAIARLLYTLISNTNIEDLFPKHDWIRHEEESAAACYHTLAAIFLRLGNIEMATECLSLSDTLEDSPRSLALKGLIARAKGETLGAVANMISSLQQYETRKSDSSGEHYLCFAPSSDDLESINRRLQSGLSALNMRDNNSALEHFTRAVFNFDPFYREYGIEE